MLLTILSNCPLSVVFHVFVKAHPLIKDLYSEGMKPSRPHSITNLATLLGKDPK